jgi:mannose-6-phosphate isomerase-like protein (cupin superfamily)
MINKQQAEHYSWGRNCDGWHLVQAEKLSVIQERMPPHTSEVRHAHRQSRQFFFVLAGTALFELNGQQTILRPQDGIEVPPGTPHQIRNESADTLEVLVISQPPSHADRILAE